MRAFLFLAMAFIIAVPVLSGCVVYTESCLPPSFGIFPPQFVGNPPGFNLIVFIAVGMAVLGVALLLLMPQYFGFKSVTPKPWAKPSRFPWWFWAGLVATLFFWWLMWARPVEGALRYWVYYAFTPLWWGFIITLDGLCYRLSGGYSLLAKKPHLLFISAIVSVFGWFLFEYLDYFSLGNWFYPNTQDGKLPFTHMQLVAIFLLAYTTVWPAIFEWYVLLNQIPPLVAKYSHGPKIKLSAHLLIVGGTALLIAMTFYPYPFFWVLWIGPMMIIGGALIKLNINSPLSDLANGNWSPMLLMALASLFNGFFWECWNYGSAHPENPIGNPNYWQYDVPYVNVIHIFAEMPILGYFGYLPFGVLVWLLFIWAGKLFSFDTQLLPNTPAKK